jgi:hypothetical protein
MAEIPRPPDLSKADLADLARYHSKMSDFYRQLADTQGKLTFKENLGALMTEPAAVEVSAGDFGTAGIEVPCDFEPTLVLFKAAAVDTNGKPTGAVSNGCVAWRIGTRSGADGFTAISGSYLNTGRHNVTIIAFPG